MGFSTLIDRTLTSLKSLLLLVGAAVAGLPNRRQGGNMVVLDDQKTLVDIWTRQIGVKWFAIACSNHATSRWRSP